MDVLFFVIVLFFASPQPNEDDALTLRLLESGEYRGVIDNEGVIKATTRLLSYARSSRQGKLLLARGEALSELGELEKGARDLEQARRLLPDAPEVGCLLVGVYVRLKKDTVATELAKDLMYDFPKSARVHHVHGGLQFTRGDLKGALRSMTKAIELDPKHANSYYNRSLVLSHMSQYAEALRDIDMSISLAPDTANEASFSLKGAILTQLGRYEESISYHRLALKFNKSCREAALGLANAYYLTGKTALGARVAIDLWDQWPDDANVAKIALTLFLEAGQIERSSKIADQLLKDHSDNATILICIANLHTYQRKYEQALDFHRKSLKVAPTEDATWGAFSLFLSACPDESFRDGAEALRIALRLCEKTDWKNPGHIAGLAAACAEKGEFATANDYLEKAATLLRTTPDMRVERTIEAMKSHFAQKRPYRFPVQ